MRDLIPSHFWILMRVFSQFLSQLEGYLSDATFATLAVHFFWALALIWWLFGFTAMAVTAVIINQVITAIDRRQERSTGVPPPAHSASGREDI